MKLHRMGHGWEGIKQFPFLLVCEGIKQFPFLLVCLASEFHNYTASLAQDSFLWLMLLEKLANVEKHRDVLTGV